MRVQESSKQATVVLQAAMGKAPQLHKEAAVMDQTNVLTCRFETATNDVSRPETQEIFKKYSVTKYACTLKSGYGG